MRKKNLKVLKKRTSVFTFGFGKDHDANMLRAISEEGQGIYYFLEKKDDIPKSFADCLGGLLSVVSQNITLTIEMKNDCKIEKSLSSFKTKEVEKYKKLEINLGDLLSEEKRDILFKLKIPKIDKENKNFDVCKVSLSYLNVIEMNNETLDFFIPTMQILDKNSNNFTISIELDKQKK